MQYSVLILTKNEQVNIGGCLDSLDSDDIWILDSMSEDGTIDIAKAHGVNIVERKFDNYKNQRNYGLSLPFKNNWILMLDADERLPTTLADELPNFLADLDENVGMVSVLRRDYLFGKWLKGASGYPSYFPRLFKKGAVVVEREINEQYRSGSYKSILTKRFYIEHYPFNKGVYEWLEKHNNYSSMETNVLYTNKSLSLVPHFDYFTFRSMMKRIIYRLPGRPILVFLILYFFRGGFLAGKSGLLFCSLRLSYEIQISAKLAEKKYLKKEEGP